jgi:hypothetical protein
VSLIKAQTACLSNRKTSQLLSKVIWYAVSDRLISAQIISLWDRNWDLHMIHLNHTPRITLGNFLLSKNTLVFTFIVNARFPHTHISMLGLFFSCFIHQRVGKPSITNEWTQWLQLEMKITWYTFLANPGYLSNHMQNSTLTVVILFSFIIFPLFWYMNKYTWEV